MKREPGSRTRPLVWIAILFAVGAAAATLGVARRPEVRGTASAQDVDGRKLAPYVPTPHDVVDRMLALAQVGKNDFVVDLGCGDGRIPIAAARKYGARGLGVDIDPERIEEAEAGAALQRLRIARDGLQSEGEQIQQQIVRAENALSQVQKDSERELAPLRRAEGALAIDSSNLDADAVAERVIREIRSKILAN